MVCTRTKSSSSHRLCTDTSFPPVFVSRPSRPVPGRPFSSVITSFCIPGGTFSHVAIVSSAYTYTCELQELDQARVANCRHLPRPPLLSIDACAQATYCQSLARYALLLHLKGARGICSEDYRPQKREATTVG
jgi:hypothetical protein